VIISVTLFGAFLGAFGALVAVPLTASIQIVLQELTKARRERIAALGSKPEPEPETS
jgi:predicted PurR-regulated permease PerM